MEESLEYDAPAWRSRPATARLVRVAIVAIPFVAVTFGAWKANGAVGPAGSVVEALVRWAALSVVCTLLLLGIDRGAKRVLPLVALLHLSVVFPDDAPSRFKVALRRGSTRQLARDVASLGLDDATPQEAAEYLLAVVARLSSHDRRTRGHTERVRAYADMVGEEMGLSEEEREKLHWGGLVHDIGKMTVPEEILNKRTPLTDREWSRLQTHPNEGWKIVQPLRGWLGEWARATRDHHERWDGSGYPRGLRGQEISRAGRIIAVADAFDVMTTSRSYTEPMSFDRARAELARCAGAQFDPEVVRAFLSLSLSRRRRTGPLTWLANSPIAMQISSVAQAPVVATSALAAAVTAAAVVAPVIDPPTDEAVAERVVHEVADPPAPTTTVVAAPSTTTTTSTTTTVPPTTAAPTTVPPTTVPTTSVAPTTVPPTTVPPTTVAPTSVPPTTTAAVIVEVTTTTLPPSRFDGGYLGGGSPSPVFDMVSAVTGSGATNWDTARNDDPGLTLTPDPAGLVEISADHVAAWRMTATQDLELSGRATLLLHAAVADFDTAAFGGLLGGLVDCADGIRGCVTIGQGSAVFSQSTFGADFGVVTIDLGAVSHTVTEGRSLVASVAVPGSITRDVWLAFGTRSYPSMFRLD